jgi:hypothetical protein
MAQFTGIHSHVTGTVGVIEVYWFICCCEFDFLPLVCWINTAQNKNKKEWVKPEKTIATKRSHKYSPRI